MVVAAITGAAGLIPTLAAIQAGRDVALANKETLVMAGELVMREARDAQVRLLPVDSEHSAIDQCLNGEKKAQVKRILLTASGGPFFGKSLREMSEVTVQEALNHPTWKMGPKITVDSATLMNKGLEVVEAHHLFGLRPGQVEIVIHPQSMVHSMVEFVDGAIIAQLGITDMRLPIGYALSYPDRCHLPVPSLDLFSLQPLEFHPPDPVRFPCLRLAEAALQEGRTFPAALNARQRSSRRTFSGGTNSFSGHPRHYRGSAGPAPATGTRFLSTSFWKRTGGPAGRPTNWPWPGCE